MAFALLAIILVGVIIGQAVYRRQKMFILTYQHNVDSLKVEILSLSLEIKQNEEEMAALEQARIDNEAEIKKKEIELNQMVEEKSKLIDEKARLFNFLFKKTPIYHRIEKLSKQNRKDKKQIQVLVAPEQANLKNVLFEIYSDYIEYLHATYSKLTDEDCIYCCLRLCDFDTSTIAYCFGNTDKQIVAQRKLRLKKKMSKEESLDS